MDNRAVSVTVSYIITLIIATLLIGGILMAAGGLIESQSNTATIDEFDVIGEKLAANIMSADRTVSVALEDAESTGYEDFEIGIKSTVPRQVSGSNYHIIIDWDNESIQLVTLNTDIAVDVSFKVRHGPSGTTTISPGNIEITFDGDQLEVSNS